MWGILNESDCILLTQYHLSAVPEPFGVPTYTPRWNESISLCLLHWFCPVQYPMHCSRLLCRYKNEKFMLTQTPNMNIHFINTCNLRNYLDRYIFKKYLSL